MLRYGAPGVAWGLSFLTKYMDATNLRLLWIKFRV